MLAPGSQDSHLFKQANALSIEFVRQSDPTKQSVETVQSKMTSDYSVST